MVGGRGGCAMVCPLSKLFLQNYANELLHGFDNIAYRKELHRPYWNLLQT